MGTLPTDRDTSDTAADHVTDHNTLHGLNNQLGSFTQSGSAPGSPASGDLWLDTATTAASGTYVGTLGYAQVTSNQASITTEVDLTSLTVTVTVTSGHRIKITGQALFTIDTANRGAAIAIKESTTQLNQGNAWASEAGFGVTVKAEAVLTPSAGSHTYKLTAQRGGSTGTLTMVAGATNPAFILVEDIGT